MEPWILETAAKLGVAPIALATAMTGNPSALVQWLASQGIEPPEAEAKAGPSPGEALVATANIPEVSVTSGFEFPMPTPSPLRQPQATGAPIDLRPQIAQGTAQGLGEALSGVKAPAPPEMQRLGTPSAPQPSQAIPQGNLEALLQQLGLGGDPRMLSLGRAIGG